MSALTSGGAARTLTLPLRSPLPKAAPKRTTPLRLVPQRRSSAAKAPFVLVVVMLLVGGLLGLLLLNTLVAQDSFQLHDLGKQGKALAQQEEDLSRQVQALQAPGELAARASALGMVQGNAPAFLRLSDGKVLGVATAGAAPVVPAVPKAAPKAVPAVPAAPAGSTTWTAPRPTLPPVAGAAGAAAHKPRTTRTPPTTPAQPTSTGAHR